METRHTQGPWVMVRRAHGNHSPREVDRIESGREDEVICFMALGGSCDNEANARLIAAAPELLEFVRAFRDANYEEDGWIDLKSFAKTASALIAKAEGK